MKLLERYKEEREEGYKEGLERGLEQGDRKCRGWSWNCFRREACLQKSLLGSWV